MLAGGVAAIFAAALAPYAGDAWREHQLRRHQAEQHRIIEEKQREIECLDRLAAKDPGAIRDVGAEIERCRTAASSAP